MKVSQKKDRENYDKVAKRILQLAKKQPFEYGPSDPLRNLREDYFQLAKLIVKAQKSKKNRRIRNKIRKNTKSLVLNAINFHLNFFRPSLLGLSEEKALKRLMKEMRTVFINKDADYGSVFRFWGIPGLLVRIGDKYFRLVQLSRKKYKRRIKDERVPDTALDLANYGIMLLMLLDENYPLQWADSVNALEKIRL